MSRFKEQAVVRLPCPTTWTSGVAEPDADEELELDRVPLPEAIGRVRRGEWNDGKSALAMLRAQYQWRP
jgi:hypothetical protein